MPGLLRGVARTAAIAGTATAVSNRVSRRQYNRWSSQEQQQAYEQQPQAPEQQPQAYQEPPPAAPPPEAADAPDPLEQLKQLGELRQSGVLTDAEFEAQKQRILGSTYH